MTWTRSLKLLAVEGLHVNSFRCQIFIDLTTGLFLFEYSICNAYPCFCFPNCYYHQDYWLVGWILWHTNSCRLFNAKSSFYTHTHTHTHMSILLYGCTTWTLTKRLEKKLDGNYTRMLRAVLNKSWRQHPRRHQLYGHLPPITKTIQVRRTRFRETLLEKQGRAHKWCTPMDPQIWPCKSRTTSSNLHTATMWGHRM